ncbi:transcriptional antitermination N peptide [Escherichia coli]|uniref:transcriptional antitermination N peptide n=1 Tax=Escherichia coli TaxID=562 RepID=UPI003FA36891
MCSWFPRTALNQGNVINSRHSTFSAPRSTKSPTEIKLSGCVRADKAASLGSLRCKKADECSGSICLPNVAIYAAGYRKSKQLTAR